MTQTVTPQQTIKPFSFLGEDYLQRYKVLKDIYVNAGPPFVLPKGSEVILYKAKKRREPVLGMIFEDKETHEFITHSNWANYLKPVK